MKPNPMFLHGCKSASNLGYHHQLVLNSIKYYRHFTYAHEPSTKPASLNTNDVQRIISKIHKLQSTLAYKKKSLIISFAPSRQQICLGTAPSANTSEEQHYFALFANPSLTFCRLLPNIQQKPVSHSNIVAKRKMHHSTQIFSKRIPKISVKVTKKTESERCTHDNSLSAWATSD